MPSAEFEPAIPAIERPQTYALHHAATGIGHRTVGLQVDQTNKNELGGSGDSYCEEQKYSQGLIQKPEGENTWKT